jgi:hypothetical protein
LGRGFQGVSRATAYGVSDVKFFSAIVGHYVADAHVPLHAVLNYDGQLTGQNGVHTRFEEDLFVRYGKQLNIQPPPLQSIPNVRDFIFDTLLESYQNSDALLAADSRGYRLRRYVRRSLLRGVLREDQAGAGKTHQPGHLERGIGHHLGMGAGGPPGASSQSTPSASGRRGAAHRPLRSLHRIMALDVYLLPLGAERYELYCEHVVEEEALNDEAPAGTGRIAALLHRFKAAVARVEQEQQSGALQRRRWKAAAGRSG